MRKSIQIIFICSLIMLFFMFVGSVYAIDLNITDNSAVNSTATNEVTDNETSNSSNDTNT